MSGNIEPIHYHPEIPGHNVDNRQSKFCPQCQRRMRMMPHRRERIIPSPSLLVCPNARRGRTFSLLCCICLAFAATRASIWVREHFALPPSHLFSRKWDIDTSSPPSSTRSYSDSPWPGSSSMLVTCDGCCTGGRSPTRWACLSETASSISSCTF